MYLRPKHCKHMKLNNGQSCFFFIFTKTGRNKNAILKRICAFSPHSSPHLAKELSITGAQVAAQTFGDYNWVVVDSLWWLRKIREMWLLPSSSSSSAAVVVVVSPMQLGLGFHVRMLQVPSSKFIFMKAQPAIRSIYILSIVVLSRCIIRIFLRGPPCSKSTPPTPLRWSTKITI